MNLQTKLSLLAACLTLPLATQNLPAHDLEISSAPSGPYRVLGNQIKDSTGRAFLMRGTQLPEFRPETAVRDSASGIVFGPYSATSLAAIRLRFNMNTVRLPLNVQDAGKPGYFADVAKLVRAANEAELLVVLAAREPDARMPSEQTVDFWRRCAAYFKTNPNVMFEAFPGPSPEAVAKDTGNAHSAAGWEFWREGGTTADGHSVVGFEELARVIRSAGATQPILATSWNDEGLFAGAGSTPLLSDPNVIYEVNAHLRNTRNDADRDAQFGLLADRVPVAANGWDLEVENKEACSAIPSDPAAVSALVKGNLNYFDAHRISWTVSVMEPGKLVKDLAGIDATSLENGWKCGEPAYPQGGLGRLVQAHLKGTEERELFVVSTAGGADVPRGGMALAYGPVMADKDSRASSRASASSASASRLPLTLGNLSVEVTDSAGMSRRAGISWASAGWGQLNFVVPAESAPGPGWMSVVRADGSRSRSRIIIADAVPGFLTGQSCAGPATGSVIQVFAGGKTSRSPISACGKDGCKTLAVTTTKGAVTQMRLNGSGFRNVRSVSEIEITIGGVRVPVVSFGPTSAAGMDQVTLTIPASLREVGETDLVCRVKGRASNPVRIRIGGDKAAS